MSQVEEEKGAPREDHLLDHQYDGIQEYDNPMPRWWVWTFWGTFWFSVAYLFHYWVGNGVSVEAAYDEEARQAAALAAEQALKQDVSEDGLEKLMADSGTVALGNDAFQAKCAACHLEKGQGSIGPNLTDLHWIHGSGKLMEIYGVVSEGVLEKGMPAWNRQMKPEELRAVVAFVGTLRGTKVEGKAPEGTLAE
jgi:cytochrome c oxidase cbb3-type subunit III